MSARTSSRRAVGRRARVAARALLLLLLAVARTPHAAAQGAPGTPPDKPPPPAGAPPLGVPPADSGAPKADGTTPAAPAAGAANATGGAGGKPEPLPGEPRCGWCGTTGKVPFDKGTKGPDLEDDHGGHWKVDYCSEAISGENQGIKWMPCPNCKTPSLKALADKEYEQLTTANITWLNEQRKTDTLTKTEKPLVHVQSTHFCIVTDIPKVTTPDKKNYKTHEMAHLYIRRLEELYERFQTMFGVTDSDNLRNMHFVFIFEKQEQQFLAAPVYTALSGEPTVRRAGGSKDISAVVTLWDKSEFPKDQDMWRHQIHEAIHQFSAVYYNFRWFKVGADGNYEKGLSPPWLNDKYGWLDEGLSHWFEIDFDGIANTYCFREQDAHSRWGSADWRKNIYKAVLADDVPSFPEVITKPSQSLSAKEHQFCWSWVDFLMQRDRLAVGKAMKLAKQKTDTRDILKQAWSLSIPQFLSEWTDYVKDAYAPSNKGK